MTSSRSQTQLMKWIGLTGGIASGKSTVSKLLRARGYAVVDADQLAREVVQSGTDGHREVVAAFGQDAVSNEGELDRKKIGAIVFKDPAKLRILEGIIHPKVRALALQRRRELELEGREAAFYDVPLLFEKQMKPLFDRVLAVICSERTQLERLIKRDGLSREEAERRLKAQIPIAEKAKLADDVILNDGTLQDLEKNLDAFLMKSFGARLKT